MGPRFESTAWSVIVAARGTDSAAARCALEVICSRYWLPLYFYVRRQGYAQPEAEDLTQGFFAHLLTCDLLQRVQPERGRFRTYLLTCLGHFMANEWVHDRAGKRGGGVAPISLDFKFAEREYALVACTAADPHIAFDRQWAETLLDTAALRLEGEYRRAGKLEHFQALRYCLGRDANDTDGPSLTARLGLSEGALRVAIHRMRRRFAAITRDEIAQTVDGEDEIRDELSYLIQVMSG